MSHFLTRKLALFSLCLVFIYIMIGLLTLLGVVGSNFTLTSTQVYQNPTLTHWLGTDVFGRDIFSRALQGTLIALSVGTMSALIALSIGVSLGAIAGYFGGVIDDAIVWFYTTWDSIPYILLLAAFAWALGQGLTNVFWALGLTSWVTTCRLIRAEFIKHKNLEYVTAARALGFGDLRVIASHILPNVSHIIAVQFGLCFVAAVKIEVILSFLGLGVAPGTPSWGLMIDEGKQEIVRGFWWNVIGATGFMFGLVLAVNLLVESLRDYLDPRRKT